MVIIRKIKSNIEYNHFDLKVDYSEKSRILTIFANPFRISGIDYKLEEDEQYEIPIYEERTHIDGYLVELEDGTIRVLFDESSDSKPPFNFDESKMKSMGSFIKIETQGNNPPTIEISTLVDTSDEEAAEASIIDFYNKIGTSEMDSSDQ